MLRATSSEGAANKRSLTPGRALLSDTGSTRCRTATTSETSLWRSFPQMRAFARSLCRDPSQAEDLAQETLAKAWAKRSSYTPGTNMKAWTFMILRNQFYSDKRRSWRSCPLDVDEAERTLVAVSSPDASLELDELRRAMAMLPDDQREALILIGAAGLSYEEAAEVTGAAIGTVSSSGQPGPRPAGADLCGGRHRRRQRASGRGDVRHFPRGRGASSRPVRASRQTNPQDGGAGQEVDEHSRQRLQDAPTGAVRPAPRSLA